MSETLLAAGTGESGHGARPVAGVRVGELHAGIDLLVEINSLPDHPRTADPLRPFGRYLLRNRVGGGANGVVLLADDPRLDRQVVVKVPQLAVLADAALRERFVREARAAAGLEHSGIVPVYESGEVGGLPYLAAGYVPGPSLETWLDDRPGPVPPRDAARLVAEVATAVHHAHERGVLHCDLKPSNVLLHRAGPADGGLAAHRPAVTDFGLARMTDDDPALTRTFQVAGTPMYMAPEQALGVRRNLTARADVYALGAVLYRLLTGRTVFDGASADEVMNRLLRDPPVCPRAVNPRVPRDLAAICLECLHKAPQRRYPSAAELNAELNRFLAGRPVAARRQAPLSRAARAVARHPGRAAAGVAGVALVVLLGLAQADNWAAGVRHQADVRALEAERVTADERAAAGEFVATAERLRQRREDREPDWPARNLADLRRLAAAAVAADHQPLLRTEAAAALTGIDLGVPRAVAEGFRGYVPAFSPDGATLAIGAWLPERPGTATVRLLDPATGAERRALSYPTDADWERRYAAYRKIERRNNDGCRSLTFSPDGRWLLLGTRSGWLVRWDLADPTPTAVRWRHAPPVADPRTERVNGVAFSARGVVAASSDGRTAVVWEAGRGWAEAYRSDQGRGDVVRPARHGDPLFVQLRNELRAVRETAPWVGATDSADFAGHFPTAGPRGELFFSVREVTAVWPFTAGPSPGMMPPFFQPGETRTDDGPTEGMAVSPDGTLLATAVEQLGHLKLWSVVSGTLLSARTLGTSGSMRLTFAPDGRTLAVCTENRTLLYAIPASPVAGVVGFEPYPLQDVAVASDAVATVGLPEPTACPVLQTRPRAPGAGRPDGPRTPVVVAPSKHNNAQRVAIRPGGGVAVTSDESVWVRWGSGHKSQSPRVENLSDLAFGPDGRLWLAATDLQHYGTNGSTGTVSLPAEGGDAIHPHCLAVGPDRVLAGLSDGELAWLDPRTAAVVSRVPVFDQPVSAVAVVPGGKAAAGSSLGAVRVVDLRTWGVETDLPTAHRDAVQAVAVGPGGWLATGSRDRTVKVWDPAGRPVLTLHHTRPVRRLFWSGDGKTLTILAEGERGLRRWDLDKLKAELTALGIDPRLP